jgi:hypothetical protein
MVGWLVMMSAVSQLNANYGQKIDREQKELEKVTEDAEKATNAYLDTTEKARLEQDLTQRELRLKDGLISSADRRRSLVIGEQEALSYRLKGSLRDAENAKTNLDNREAEKVKDEELLARKKDEIAKAQALNAELKTQLAQLQDEFKKILAENTARLKAPATKPASALNTSPSS